MKLLSSLLPLAACDDSDPRVDSLEESRAQWEAFRDEGAGGYSYRRRSRSWVGFGSTTRFSVENNRVTERTYIEHDAAGKTIDTWTETGAALGSHAKGAPVRTIDQLYDQCAD